MTTTLIDSVVPRTGRTRPGAYSCRWHCLLRRLLRRLLAELFRAVGGRHGHRDCSHPRARSRVRGLAGDVRGPSSAGCDGTRRACICDWGRGCSRSASVLIRRWDMADGARRDSVARSSRASWRQRSEGCSGRCAIMVVFTPFLAAGWIYRRRPEIHKRIMLVATTILLIAAVSRIGCFWHCPRPRSLFLHRVAATDLHCDGCTTSSRSVSSIRCT